ncbi:hypothetical protein K438DRAFT_2013323 [Mycena galopus ATCC 62051]|nr:hypothetical protein K438DRAFT_2013323 [Mycena galopus ATCC 62051]
MAGTGVELLFGPLLIGVILSTLTYGIMSVQMLLYYQAYKKSDARWIRYFMLYLFFAETANLLIEIGIIYEPLIVRYGAQRALIISPIRVFDFRFRYVELTEEFGIVIPGDAVSIVAVSTPVQMFTAWRISVITGSVILPFIISVFSVVSFGGGLLVTIFASIRNEFREFQSFSGAVIVWLVSSAVCDVLITVVLTYSLVRVYFFPRASANFGAASRPPARQAMQSTTRSIELYDVSTDSSAGTPAHLITSTEIVTVQTGAITTVAALADVILFLVFPATTLNFIPDFPLSKLYTISLLSTLNARARGRSDAENRMPNALFNESTTQKSTIHTMRNSVLPNQCPVRVFANTYQSEGTAVVPQFVVEDVADVSPKETEYPRLPDDHLCERISIQ